jgi:hypothetical protein
MVLLGNYHRAEFIELYRQHLPLHRNDRGRIDNRDNNCSVVFQSYPGEFSQSAINRLIIAEPFAPILLFLGAACEGEMRTGCPLNGCFRLYVHQWNDFYRHQLSLHINGNPSLLSLPRTAENDDIVLFQTEAESRWNIRNRVQIQNQTQNRKCVIVSRLGCLGNDFEMNRFFADFYSRQGFRTRIADSKMLQSLAGQSFNGIILADIDDSPFWRILQSVQRLRRVFTDSKIAVYINSPRINEKIELQQFGVDEIFSKPVFW